MTGLTGLFGVNFTKRSDSILFLINIFKYANGDTWVSSVAFVAFVLNNGIVFVIFSFNR